ncbi:DUF3889 domain-containing protein [Lysinibacillus sp. NPDC096418]|uniref:DUF3889 domain-containing protein n=1 Tax=Lysinibacillus sp. NPDC096418 TaxID=3364138 RepID=UPI00381F8441
MSNDIKQMTHPIRKEMSSIMRKKIIALGALLTANVVPTQTPITALAQQEIPSYAKWGQLAIKETKTKYPNAKIIDYLYEGSESKEASTIEKFKLWLKEGDHEFGVFVRIEFITDTEKMVKIEFQETTR